jgi:hypothetical protein
MRILSFFFCFGLAIAGCAPPEYEMVFRVEAGNHHHLNNPVYVELDNRELDENASVCIHHGAVTVPGQVENLEGNRQRIWWIVNLEPGESVNYGLTVNDGCATERFAWDRVGGHSTRLLFNGNPVIRYEHPVFDPGDIEGTKKPFHHVFEPSGDGLITKGPGGLYSHHRGIFFGYNHVYTNDRRIDIWHANEGERSEHVEVIREFSGPVFGGHEVRIHWIDHDGNPFLEEHRTVRVFRQDPGETLIDFASVLRATEGPVRLEGDRQHAGVQFRASQYVADNPEYSMFIRPPGWNDLDPREEIGETRMHDLPWNAMHFRVNDSPFTVSYMSHPSNPDNAEMSERLYGRFGEFFTHRLEADTPLAVHYRFWITEGEAPSAGEIDMRYQGYAYPYGVPAEREGIFGPIRHGW